MVNTIQARNEHLIELFDSSSQEDEHIAPFWIVDESEFRLVLAHRGRKRLALPEEAAKVDRRRQPRPPRAPRIQGLLSRASALQDRLDREPGLTRDALARDIGMDPSRLSQLLGLLNLAPEIRQRILALPPSVTTGTVTERRLRPIARLKDRVRQLLEFERLLTLPERRRARVEALAAPDRAVAGQEGAPFFTSNQSRI